MTKRANKKNAAAAAQKAPRIFNVKLTAADISNLMAIINAASIKGNSAGTIHELKKKLVDVLPPMPKKGEKDEGDNPKTK